MNAVRPTARFRVAARSAVLLLALLHTSVGRRPVHAQARTESTSHGDAAQARAFFEIGAQAYEQGDYRAALEAFHEAYVRAERPGLLFSMAQAHRRAFFARNDQAELARAVEHYRKYLASGDGARRREAEDALSQLVPLASSAVGTPVMSAAAKQGGKLMIASNTPGAVLRVDGTVAERLPYVASVVPGTHKLELSAPGFRAQTRELPVLEGTAFALELSLEELPGSVTVDGAPKSELWIDGRLVGALPLPPLALKSGLHQLSLRRPGYRSTTRKLAVERGRATRVELELVPTTQRKVSIGLLWGGTAVLLTGAAVAVAAYARQRTAAHLHSEREQRELQAHERDRYEEALAARNRLRGASLGLAGAGAACVLLGAALYGFEHPQVPALLEHPPRERKPGGDKTPTELIGGPVFDGKYLGIEAHGRF